MKKEIPAIPMFMIVRNYAFQVGLPFFTKKEQDNAFEHYKQHAKYLN